jgi:uncharacterized protein (TIGR03437 family)
MNRNRLCHSIFLLTVLAVGVMCVQAQSALPVINANGVVEGASFTQAVAAGGIASIFGSNLGPSAAAATTVPLPTVINGVTVTLNGAACPLFYVSPSQINFQVLWEVLPLNSATLVVSTAAGKSNSYTVVLSAAAPGVFTVATLYQGAVLISNTGIFAASAGSIPGANARPVMAGEYISIFCSGLGAVSNQPADGAASPAGKTLATIKAQIQVGINLNFAVPSFAGLAPGFVGLYQVDIQVPPGVSGGTVPVTVSVNGVNALSVEIAVQ